MDKTQKVKVSEAQRLSFSKEEQAEHSMVFEQQPLFVDS
jgi:hypothetical protein